jgi:heme iron utilization protein
MKLEQIVATHIGPLRRDFEGNEVETPKQEATRRAKALIVGGGTAALSVVDVDGGAPFTTLVNVAADAGAYPLLLMSALSHHSKCLAKDKRGSLMLHEPLNEADPMLTFRVSLLGAFEQVSHDDVEKLFLKRHPYAELYTGLGDFSYWRMVPDHAHIIAGFGRAYGVRFVDVQQA